MNLNILHQNKLVESFRTRHQKKRDKRGKWIFASLLVLISTALVVYFLPRTNTFNYEYNVGEPWRYGPIYASHQYVVHLSDSDLAEQRNVLRRQFQPYFRLSETTRKSMQNKLARKAVSDLTFQERAIYRQHLSVLLDSIYARGIISDEQADSLRQAGTNTIRIIDEEGEVKAVSVADIFTTHAAFQHIFLQDSATFQAEMLNKFDIASLLKSNTVYLSKRSERELDSLLAAIPADAGVVKANERIVDKGELVSPLTFRKVKCYEELMAQQSPDSGKMRLTLLGQVMVVLSIMCLLAIYVALFRNDYYDEKRHAILAFGLVVVFSIAASLMVSHHFYRVHALPVCMVPIFLRIFLDSRTAFLFHTATVLLVSLVITYPHEYIIVWLLIGLVAIYALRELIQRSQIVHTAIIVAASAMFVYAAYEFLTGNNNFHIGNFMPFIINGLLLMFAYPFMWIFERMFQFTSDVTLVELSNINHPLLHKMSEVAPGTFQHSMQVANLAGEIAKKVGAKAQLVRTAALYHDIGKTERPAYFTENQSGINPHKRLTPEKSAEVIIAHVTHGLALAAQYNLPDVIRQFIATHHGRGKVKYFYITYCNEHPGEQVDESAFTYPGPNPSTVEQAILMMADSVEAASRSLSEYTEDSISNLVDKIIDSQVSDGFFNQCDITFRQIDAAKAVLKQRLQNIYHTRITYPELQNAKSDAPAAQPAAETAQASSSEPQTAAPAASAPASAALHSSASAPQPSSSEPQTPTQTTPAP